MNLDDLIRKLECGPIDVCTAQFAAKALREMRDEISALRSNSCDMNTFVQMGLARDEAIAHAERAEKAKFDERERLLQLLEAMPGGLIEDPPGSRKVRGMKGRDFAAAIRALPNP